VFVFPGMAEGRCFVLTCPSWGVLWQQPYSHHTCQSCGHVSASVVTDVPEAADVSDGTALLR
jgi:hypothetical protein